MFTMTANAVMSVSTVATVLRAGIQAGTGAELGTPLQLAKRMMVQKVKRARCRLCSGRFINF